MTDQIAISFDAAGGAPAAAARNAEQEAVLAFDRDLVVAAGAGSGKTTVLVDLYLRILERPELVGVS